MTILVNKQVSCYDSDGVSIVRIQIYLVATLLYFWNYQGVHAMVAKRESPYGHAKQYIMLISLFLQHLVIQYTLSKKLKRDFAIVK